MDDATRGTVRFVAAQLVFVAAFVHLAMGLIEWQRWFGAGFLVPRDLRWPVFVVLGLAIVVGMYVAYRAENRRPFYAAGVAVMLGFVVGYFVWHLTGHQPLLLFGGGPGTEDVSVEWFLDHLFAGPLEFVSIAVEIVAAALLTLLYFDEA